MDNLFHAFSFEDKEDLMHGVYTGFVTDNKDPEKLGRVKVKIPVIDDQKELGWSRISTWMSGNNRGALFIPEVGDEVLIAFLLGDIRSPIVIGSLWNNVEKPPEGKNDQNDVRKIRTRAGHEIIFDDTSKEGGITVKTASGHQLLLDEKKNIVQLSGKDSGQKLLMDGSSGNITVSSGSTKVSIDKNGPIKLETNADITVKGVSIAIEAKNKLELKAMSSLDINCSGIVNIKGAMVKIN